MMDVFLTLPYQQNKGELVQLCSTPLFFVGKVGDGWPRKSTNFVHKKITDQKAKCSTTIRNTTFWYCGGTVGSTAGVQFLVLVLCDGLSTAGTAFLYWALYWYGTVLCIGPQHNLETNKFSCEQASHWGDQLPWRAPAPFFFILPTDHDGCFPYPTLPTK